MFEQYHEALCRLLKLARSSTSTLRDYPYWLHRLDVLWVRLMEPEAYTLIPTLEEPCA